MSRLLRESYRSQRQEYENLVENDRWRHQNQLEIEPRSPKIALGSSFGVIFVGQERPRAPKSARKASQKRHRAPQERPKSAPATQERAKEAPRGPQGAKGRPQGVPGGARPWTTGAIVKSQFCSRIELSPAREQLRTIWPKRTQRKV